MKFAMRSMSRVVSSRSGSGHSRGFFRRPSSLAHRRGCSTSSALFANQRKRHNPSNLPAHLPLAHTPDIAPMNVFIFLVSLVLIEHTHAQNNPCNVGYYHPPSEAGGNCYPCNPGRYSPANAMPTCIECTPGRYSSGYARTECSICDVGTYQPAGDATGCRVCPSGQTQTSRGATSCFSCEIGYTAINSSSPCLVCPAGTKWEHGNNGLGICIPCPMGSFSESPGSTECEVCPYNTFGGYAGASSCVSCDPGFFTYGRNSTRVDDCVWCEDAIGTVWPQSTWPYTESYSVVNMFTCMPYLCNSANAVGRTLCRNFINSDITHLSDLCSLPTPHNDDVFSVVIRDSQERIWMYAVGIPLGIAVSFGMLISFIIIVQACRKWRVQPAPIVVVVRPSDPN